MLITRGGSQPRDAVLADQAAAGQVPIAQHGGNGRAARRVSRRWALLLFLGWVGQAGLRVWFSRMQSVPLANPDESAYLIAARVLAGGPGADFSYGTLYRGGYPLLITPAYWFTSNPVTVYHAALVINALVSAALMPLAYLACRRLGARRWVAFGVSAVTALLPEGFFYSEYALADAIFPVVVLAWLLSVHSLLTAAGTRSRYVAAVTSAVLAGYAYAVHPRGTVIVAGYVAVLIFAIARRLVPRWTAAAAGLALAVTVAAAELLDRHIAAAMYPEGARSLTGEMWTRLTNGTAELHVLEMAGGQLWRLTLDTWGIAAIGLLATTAAVLRRDVRVDLRIMAALSVAVTLAIVYTAPAALPADQPAVWASGRYPDCMSVAFFVVGLVVLLRAARRRILLYSLGVVALAGVTAAGVISYAGSSLATAGFAAFNFAEPAVLTQGWTQVSVPLATAVAVSLLAFWILAAALLCRFASRWRCAVLIPVAAMNLFALAQMTTHISQAGTPAQLANSRALVTGAGLKRGERIAIGATFSGDWAAWIPQAVEVPWTELQFFDGTTPPAGVTVVEMSWPSGKPAAASWPQAPAGWRVVATDQAYGWVAWRAP